MTTAINMVMVDCRTEVEEKYNEQYNKVHVPLCLKYGGMPRATRYRLIKRPPRHARCLTVYEFKDQNAMDAFPSSPECRAATQEMRETWEDNDFEITMAAQYETIGSFEA